MIFIGVALLSRLQKHQENPIHGEQHRIFNIEFAVKISKNYDVVFYLFTFLLIITKITIKKCRNSCRLFFQTA